MSGEVRCPECGGDGLVSFPFSGDTATCNTCDGAGWCTPADAAEYEAS